MATVKLRVRELAESKGITSAYQLKKALGINAENANHIWNGKTTRITFEMMARICSHFKVKPASLFIYEE